MTRVMWDSVTPTNAMANPSGLFAGYADGPFAWPAGPLAACFLTFAVRASFLDADVLDVERGDATADQAPGWVSAKRSRGDRFAGVYCNWTTLPDVVAAFKAANEPMAPVIVARYNGDPTIPTFPGVQIFGHQWKNTPTIDVSTILDAVEGLDMTDFEHEPEYTVDSQAAATPETRLQRIDENAAATRSLVTTLQSTVASLVVAVTRIPTTALPVAATFTGTFNATSK